ncbi:MAG: hypothetical protein JOY78_04940 [Pseudonocardia sp.]|nr:hypothetical protein [Pseudonocardia sp.]
MPRTTHKLRGRALALITLAAVAAPPATAAAFPSGPIRGVADYPSGPIRGVADFPSGPVRSTLVPSGLMLDRYAAVAVNANTAPRHTSTAVRPGVLGRLP